jgi:hypothetical protein
MFRLRRGLLSALFALAFALAIFLTVNEILKKKLWEDRHFQVRWLASSSGAAILIYMYCSLHTGVSTRTSSMQLCIRISTLSFTLWKTWLVPSSKRPLRTIQLLCASFLDV